jgi:putative membrane protein
LALSDLETMMDGILTALSSGLPLLLLHFAAASVLLGIGIFVHLAMTPFREMALVEGGNVAAATVLAGTSVALALPIAASLATSPLLIDILIWGAIGLVVQLLVFSAASLLMKDLRPRIERGELAPAIVLVGWQLAFGA